MKTGPFKMSCYMKQVLKFVATSFAILAVAACAEESKETHVSFTRELTFTATREGLPPEIKSVRMDDGSTWWNANEEISVFYGSGSAGGSMFTTQNNTLQDVVEFSGSVQMSGSGKDFWAVYPYSEENECDGSSITTVIPAVQTASEGNFSDDVFPAIAKTKTTEFAFWNICGGIKFFVSRSDIMSVTIKGNNGETLAGKVKVAFNAEGHPEVSEVIERETEVTLVAPGEGSFEPSKYYYLALLPATLEGGLTLTFNTCSEKGEIVSDKSQTIKRSIFGVLKKVDSAVTEWESTVVEPEYVDLGLSLKWASCNIGASKPEEFGDYYAWGETEIKTDYSWSTYKFGATRPYTKYNGTDGKLVLDPEDDVAHCKLGGSWRMPTIEEIHELESNCSFLWTHINGTNGFLVTSSINDKTIFLPAAGYDYGNNSWGYIETRFWSSSVSTGIYAYSFKYDAYDNGTYIIHDYLDDRCKGLPVRPVYAEFIPVSSITLDKNSLELIVGDSAQLTATISPSNATAPEVRWVSGDDSVVSVDQNGNISALAEGSTTVTAYSSNGLSASCAVTVLNNTPEPEAVDLGLPSGLKWATMNVGASAPEGYGDSFAWGETRPKYNYSWSTYKWCKGSSNSQTKYCTSNETSYWGGSGSPDNKTVLDSDDDAASANWGGSWRMPTNAEWTELRNNCTWTWTDNYNGTGIAGQIVTSNMPGYESKSIFLPATGYRDATGHYYVGSHSGNYWSSSLSTGSPSHAGSVYFSSASVSRISDYRYHGLSVRPITE